MSWKGTCGFPFPVILRYQIISAKLCFFYEVTVNSGKKSYSGAFMLSTMLMRRTCRRMAKQTTKVNSMVSATASR